MAIEIVTLTAPASWASYLVNGDASGLTEEEVGQADAWLKREGVRILSTTDDEPRFTWNVRLYAPEVDFSGGDVLDYVCTPL